MVEGGKKTRKFILRGDKVIVKELVSDLVLNDYDIINDVDLAHKQIQNLKNQMEQVDQQKKTHEANLQNINKYLKEYEPFEKDAHNRLVKRLKSLTMKNKIKCMEEAKIDTKRDLGVDDETYKREVFNLYRRKLHTQPTIAKEIPDSIIRKNFYGDKTMLSLNDIIL